MAYGYGIKEKALFQVIKSFMDQTIRILWLSDIHYRKDFLYDDVLQVRIQSFLQEVELYVNTLSSNGTDNVIHYCILSGDLAFSGKENDYEKLDKDLINPLREKLKLNGQSPFLCCPGNHDVNRSKESLYQAFIEAVDQLIDKEQEYEENIFSSYPASMAAARHNISRNTILEDNSLEKAKEVFHFYSEYVKKVLPPIAEDSKGMLNNYRSNNGLYGYILDHENKLVINLLNSAWFRLVMV
ncbi:MAG: metallophosphoesterase, partial [Chitinophagaceae bacterium]|nr:metallophosphoesterase [Chitinophagaceae bacterium]